MNLLDIHGARKKAKIGRSTIFDKLNPRSLGHDPEFPKPVRIGKKSIRWVEDELDEWIAKQVHRRDRRA